MEKFFNPKSIAIIGASREKTKVGHVTLKNLLRMGFKGKVYPINPKAEKVLGLKAYSSVLKVKGTIDVALIAIPAKISTQVIKECGRKGIKKLIIVTAGFSEIGNAKLEQEIINIAKKYNMRVIGPNCLGILDVNNKFDTLFLPASRLVRPKKGRISFTTQSGATGSTVLDLMAKEQYGFAKFISYGNAADITETDLINYLGKDKDTRVICMYLESVKEGKQFLQVAKEVTKRKPIIALKGGTTSAGAKATMSHTASLAGSFEIYSGAFKQAGILQASNLEDLFNYAKIIEKSIRPKGKRVQIITNGGGFGILATDNLIKNKLKVESPSASTIKKLKKAFPKTYTVGNPIDLTGSATSKAYKLALQAAMQDKKVDIIFLILLYQTPQLDVDIVDYVIKISKQKKKPIAVVSMGGNFTMKYRNKLEAESVPCFTYPHNAARAIKALCEYYIKK